MTKAEIMKRLDEARMEKVPDGWKPASKLAKEWSLSIARTTHMIRQGVAIGICKRKDFRVIVNGKLVRMPHYLFK